MMAAHVRVRRIGLTGVLLSLALAGTGFASNASSVGSAAVGAPAPPVPPGVSTPTPTKPGAKKWTGPFVVVIVVDAARYDEFNLAQMPNLAKLASSGVQYSQAWVGQLPSVTEASHATIGTGVMPTRHGILGDTWRVPGTEQMSPNLLNSQLTRTGFIGKLIKQSGVPSVAAITHLRWPGSKVVTLSGHKVYAADALGAGSADYIAYGGKDARGHFVPSTIPGHEYDASILHSPQLDLPAYPRQPGQEDDWTTTLALKFLFEYHPRVMMINLPEVDVYGHIAGTDATVMQPLISNVDKQIGRLVAAYGRAHILPQTTFLITSDHGMVPALHTVDSEQIKSIVTKAGGVPLYVGHGDYSSVWLKNPQSIGSVKRALVNANLPNVAAIYARSPRGNYLLASPASRLADPAVANAQTQLLSTLNVAESPDIVLVYDENTITMTPGFMKSGRKGDHGGATWGAQHIPLIIKGPRIKKGLVSTYPARLVDIAPTIESLLETYAQRQDGTPLADAILNPPGGSVAAQARNGVALRVDVEALQREAALRPNTTPGKSGAK
jgi:arylsulfatase A-like enzyme